MGYLYGEVYIIDLTDNTYSLYQPINIKTPVKGEWDEPDNFPGFTNAYFQTIDAFKLKVDEFFAAQ